MEAPTKCPKCGSNMEEGIVRPSAYTHQLVWTEPPQGQWIAGVDDPKQRKCYGNSLRCTACGYLELYAPTD